MQSVRQAPGGTFNFCTIKKLFTIHNFICYSSPPWGVEGLKPSPPWGVGGSSYRNASTRFLVAVLQLCQHFLTPKSLPVLLMQSVRQAPRGTLNSLPGFTFCLVFNFYLFQPPLGGWGVKTPLGGRGVIHIVMLLLGFLSLFSSYASLS
jgi:hypothetical protein